MPSAVKWESAWTSRGTVLTTELNALADGARSAAGTEVNNSTNLDQYGKLELSVDFVAAPGAGAYVTVYMITAPDGTNYEDGGSSAAGKDPGAHTLAVTIPVRADTAAQRLMSQMFTLQPAKTKFLLAWEAGTGSAEAFPASGSTLTLYSNNDEIQN